MEEKKTKKQKTTKTEEKKKKGKLGDDINNDWKGHIVTTREDDPPVKGGPQKCYLGMITEDDCEGHCKVDWMGKEVGEVLNFHFEKKWISKKHFDLES